MSFLSHDKSLYPMLIVNNSKLILKCYGLSIMKMLPSRSLFILLLFIDISLLFVNIFCYFKIGVLIPTVRLIVSVLFFYSLETICLCRKFF